jgi:hypothetical protein
MLPPWASMMPWQMARPRPVLGGIQGLALGAVSGEQGQGLGRRCLERREWAVFRHLGGGLQADPLVGRFQQTLQGVLVCTAFPRRGSKKVKSPNGGTWQ